MIWFRYLLLIGLIINSVSGQEYVLDRIIVKLAPDISPNDFGSILDTNYYVVEKVLVRRLNIISIKLKNNQISLVDAIKEFRNNPFVDKAILDTKVSRRDIPDDTQTYIMKCPLLVKLRVIRYIPTGNLCIWNCFINKWIIAKFLYSVY